MAFSGWIRWGSCQSAKCERLNTKMYADYLWLDSCDVPECPVNVSGSIVLSYLINVNSAIKIHLDTFLEPINVLVRLNVNQRIQYRMRQKLGPIPVFHSLSYHISKPFNILFHSYDITCTGKQWSSLGSLILLQIGQFMFQINCSLILINQIYLWTVTSCVTVRYCVLLLLNNCI